MAGDELGRETRHALLTSVERVPNVVHHRVERVVEASGVVAKEDRLNRAIPTIII